MTTGQQNAVDQRLDQHADAMEIVLSKIDELERRCGILYATADLLRRKIKNLESIILPDPDKQGSARPSEPSP